MCFLWKAAPLERTLREHLLLLNEENIKVYSYDFTWLLITWQAKEVFEFLIFCKDIIIYNSQETPNFTSHFLLTALAPIMTSSLLSKPLPEFCAYNTIQRTHTHTQKLGITLPSFSPVCSPLLPLSSGSPDLLFKPLVALSVKSVIAEMKRVFLWFRQVIFLKLNK